ncbi:MAG: hypothetical protein LKF52_13200 [Butyrivibrio sp.]|jgi:hypothetical protein|nr:hypothetical protein [Butyrivibrio sp.]
MNIEKNILYKTKLVSGLLVSALLYLLLFSAYSSPLFPKFYQYDSAIFMMVGKAVAGGKQLYVDVFDHKGPILFWINALGMWLGGRNGVFFLQCLFMMADLALMNKIIVLFGEGKQRVWMIAATLIYLAYPLANGNLSEEYSLPFIFLCLYLFLRDLQEGNEPTIGYSFIYGVGIGILMFIRANNAVTICALVLFWLVELLYEKKWLVLLKNAGIGIAGIMVVTVPICLYFEVQGSLQEMLYATFLFNMKYSSRTSFLSTFMQKSVMAHMMILFMPLIMAVFVFSYNEFSRRFKLAMELILVLNMLSLFMGFGFNHYFMIETPIILIMVILGWKLFKEKGVLRKSEWMRRTFRLTGLLVVLAVYLILSVRIIFLNVRDYYLTDTVTKEYAEVHELCQKIPEEDQDNVLGFEIPARYYLIGDILPCYKYGILQTFWSEVDPEIMQEYVSYLKNQSPEWLVVLTGADDENVDGILSQKYEQADANDYCSLYHLK